MADQPIDNSSKEIKKLLKEHLELAKKIEEQNNKIQKRLTYMVIGNYVRLSFIIIPIIIGIIYIPSFIKQVQSSVNGTPILSQLFNGSSNSVTDLLGNFSSGNLQKNDVNKLIEQFK